MRVFYAFLVKDYYFDMYYKHPYNLYKMLEEIYHFRDYKKIDSYRMFRQICDPVNKMICNGYINKIHRLSYDYINENSVHYIKKKDEHTKMVISNVYIKIISDINFPTFLTDIYTYDNNIFICDFNNNDYFWLNKIIKKDRQRDLTIVK